MKYRLNQRLIRMEEEDGRGGQGPVIEIMTLEEFQNDKEAYPHRKALLRSLEQVHYCKAEVFGPCIEGTFKIPQIHDPLGEKNEFGYYLQHNHLILIEKGGNLDRILSRMEELQYGDNPSVADFFAVFMLFLIREDAIYLQKYEHRLSEIEIGLLKELPKNFYETVIRLRKELLVLHTYYEQLVNLGEEMEGNAGHMFDNDECAAFRNFSSRAGHLHDHVEMLREYVLQIREMYQSQLDIRQNRTMNLLTVVTTIFFPLSLLVGWYGMNFNYMPELSWKYGYLLMVIVSVSIIGFEIVIFKKKKIL